MHASEQVTHVHSKFQVFMSSETYFTEIDQLCLMDLDKLIWIVLYVIISNVSDKVRMIVFFLLRVN